MADLAAAGSQGSASAGDAGLLWPASLGAATPLPRFGMLIAGGRVIPIGARAGGWQAARHNPAAAALLAGYQARTGCWAGGVVWSVQRLNASRQQASMPKP